MVKAKKKAVEVKKQAPRGIPKSGKFWKTPKEKISKIQNVPKKTKEQHLKFRDEMKRIKALSNAVKEEKKQV
jgi:hypothetical protein